MSTESTNTNTPTPPKTDGGQQNTFGNKSADAAKPSDKGNVKPADPIKTSPPTK